MSTCNLYKDNLELSDRFICSPLLLYMLILIFRAESPAKLSQRQGLWKVIRYNWRPERATYSNQSINSFHYNQSHTH